MSELLVERGERVAVMTLNRPDRLNALSHTLIAQLRRVLAELGGDDGVRAIVLTGAGRAFSSGADLSGGPSDTEAVLRDLYNPLILDMMALDKPLVAAVNGVAVGAAVSLTLACDLRVAEESASFLLSFVGIGLVPDAGATWLLPRAVGSAKAAEMTLLGKKVGAAEALGMGLVTEVTPDGDAGSRALELAHALAAPSSSVGATRKLLHRGLTAELADQLEAEATAQGVAQHGPDFRETRRAFAEKRRARSG